VPDLKYRTEEILELVADTVLDFVTDANKKPVAA
jgi:hypothetical protein